MLEALSSAEINRQHAELLPARIVLSLFSKPGASGSNSGAGSGATPATGSVTLVTLFDHQTNTSSNGGN